MGTIYSATLYGAGAMAFKYLIILMLVLIIGSLGKALYHLSSSKPQDENKNSAKMVRALTWRIALSVGLFVLLMVAYYRGWIRPQAGP
jgi:hypothetical protein